MKLATKAAIVIFLTSHAYILPNLVSAQELRFQFVLGGERGIRQACRSSNFSKYHVVNGQQCSSLKPKARKKADPIVKEIQELLNDLGYPAGKPDGFTGKNTNTALKNFMSDYGEIYDGKPSDNELAKLRGIKSGIIQKADNAQSGLSGEELVFYKYRNTDAMQFEDIFDVTRKHLQLFR